MTGGVTAFCIGFCTVELLEAFVTGGLLTCTDDVCGADDSVTCVNVADCAVGDTVNVGIAEDATFAGMTLLVVFATVVVNVGVDCGCSCACDCIGEEATGCGVDDCPETAVLLDVEVGV